VDRKGLTNVLLLVIATCLVLIVLKIYDVNFISEASAEANSSSVNVMGWYPGVLSREGFRSGEGWRPIIVDEYGRLETSSR
jgi:hypothetical protein